MTLHSTPDQRENASPSDYLLTPENCNNTPRFKPGMRFHSLFDETNPTYEEIGGAGRPAIEIDDVVTTFVTLDKMANRIGHHLQKQGAVPGDVVVLLLERSLEAYASILAVSKIGCAFVPLDVSFPDNRVQFICGDSGAQFALTTSKYADVFTGTDVKAVAVDRDASAIEGLPSHAPDVELDDFVNDGLAYIIYTSGTTGQPKGVPINHSSICNFLLVAAEEYGFKPGARVFQSLTIAFDYSFEEIWVPLLSGSCLVPAPLGVNLLGDDLAEFLIEKRITAWCSVPTVLATIETDLPDLDLLIVSGEACPSDLIDRWCTPNRRFLNLYGPTEATVSATWKVSTPNTKVTIGTPLPTYTAMILAAETDTVIPHGEEGELALAGIGIADGYLNREPETAKAFIDDFIGIENNPGKKIYRTGDLARVDENGEIEYLGRVDTQVKVRGYRIELGEIESVARTLSNFSALVVNPVEVDKGDVGLALYFVDNEQAPTDLNHLRDSMRDRLPAYMVPAYFEAIDFLPLLPSQKVNRKLLPKPSGQRSIEYSRAFVDPSNEHESKLASTLAALLKLNAVSADADFFADLGANSLTMARYLGSLRKDFDIKVSMKTIYQNTTIQKLSEAIFAQEQMISDGFNPNIELTFATDAKTASTSSTETAASSGVSNKINLESETPLIENTLSQPLVNQVDAENQHPGPTSSLQYFAFGTAQMAWVALGAFLFAASGLEVLKWLLLANGTGQIWYRAFISANAIFFGTSTLMIVVKWLAIGKFKPGTIPIWSFAHLRFWIAQTVIRGNPLNLFAGTPVYNVYLRLLGAKIGKGSLIFSSVPTATDLITIGENTVIRQRSTITGYTARNGRLYLGSVKIGSNCYLGEATVMDINSDLGDDTQLGNQSALHEGQKVNGGRKYWGSPAIAGGPDFIRVDEESVSPWRAWIYVLSQFAFNALIIGPALVTGLILLFATFTSAPELFSGSVIDTVSLTYLLLLSGAIYLSSIAIGLVYVSIAPKLWNWLFIPNQTHKLFSFQYYLAQRISRSSNNRYLQALFGDSSLIVPYFKAVGYQLRNLKQNGSNFGVEQQHHNPFLCSFNANTFVSDGLFMINTDMSRTSFKVTQISVPNNVYLGNDLHFPTAAKIGENCLVATKALIPINGELREDVGILGSPPFEIPRSMGADKKYEKYNQPDVLQHHLAMKLKSNLITLGWFMVRDWSVGFFLLAAAVSIYASYADVIFSSSITGGIIISAFALISLFATSFYTILFGRIATWLRPMKPIECSLYEQPFWDQERYWKLNYDPVRDSVFSGTPIKNVLSRCQGMKIGKQVFDDGCGFTEPSLVTVGDYCTLNYRATVQAHSLEDGIFKADEIIIAQGSTLGVEAFVHYGANLGARTDIRTDSFVMKGSVVVDRETWTANPAAPIESHQDYRTTLS